jgi:hypothetical protein
MKGRFLTVLAGTTAALAGAATSALAQSTPAEMPAVSFPLSASSIVTAIGVAGATILGLTFGIVIAFRFVKKLMRRASSAV